MHCNRTLAHYRTCLGRRPVRFARYYFRSVSGYEKLIDIARTSLKIAKHILPNDPSNREAFCTLSRADEALANTQFALSIIKLPIKIPSFYKSARKTKVSFKVILHKRAAGEVITGEDILIASARLCDTTRKALSISGTLFFKPVHFIDKHFDLGDEVQGINNAWCLISLVRSGAKIFSRSVYLSYGIEKNLLLGTTKLTLEVWKVTHVLLQLNGVAVHPYARLTLSGLKCVVGIVDVWVKTA